VHAEEVEAGHAERRPEAIGRAERHDAVTAPRAAHDAHGREEAEVRPIDVSSRIRRGGVGDDGVVFAPLG
jgi:hypothetical protein